MDDSRSSSIYDWDHELHRKYSVPVGFEPIDCDEEEFGVNPDAIPADHFIGSPHITRQPPVQSDDRVLYRFLPSSPSGAILILPFGAVRHELRDKEEFHKIVIKHGESWCSFARRDSVYLITGFHKAHSWSLGSFHSAPRGGEILVKQPNEEDENAKVHKWEPTFSMYWRAGPRNTQNGSRNQTVFITGFKVTVRWWLPEPLVQTFPWPSNVWLALFHLWVSILVGVFTKLWKRVSLKSHEHVPRLSQPFHPSDVINRYLLKKNPNIKVAVTHDSQWMRMLDMEELTYDDMEKEDYIWGILNEKFTSVLENGTVYLERKTEGSTSSLKGICPSSSSDNDFDMASEDVNRPQLNVGLFSLCGPSIDSPWIVISHIKADDVIIGRRYLPVGFYVLVQFNGIRRKTKIRSTQVFESVIEWDDQITLSDDPSVKVQLSLCAAFEFKEILGNGETLCTSEITVGELVGNTTLIDFSAGKEKACGSLLITVERQYCPHLRTYLICENQPLAAEQSSFMAQETDLGHKALLRYYEDYKADDLQTAIQHFKCALDLCPLDHECRSTALVNLATAKFDSYHASVTDADVVESIPLYREALELRCAPHPDRPAVLLGLGRALLNIYLVQKYDESVKNDLERLMNEVQETCSDRSHEHRAANSILQSFKRIRVVHRGTLPELNQLILELDAAVRVPPGDYFDLRRLENLWHALRMRFKMQGQVSDLDRAIACQEDAIQLLHEHCPARARFHHDLGYELYTRFVWFDDLRDLSRAIAMKEEAVRLTPAHHPHRAALLRNLGRSYRARFNKLGVTDDLRQAIARKEEVVRLTPENHPDRAYRLCTLGKSLHALFDKLGDVKNLDQAIAKQEEAVELTPNDHPDRVLHLETLGGHLFARYRELLDINDLDQAIAKQKEVVELTPNDHPDRVRHLVALGRHLRARYHEHLDINDIDQAIAKQEEAVGLTPNDHPDRVRHLEALGGHLCARYRELLDIDDLDRAIERQVEAADLVPENHPDRAAHLYLLGDYFRLHYTKEGCYNTPYIDRAVELYEEAIRLITQVHPARAGYVEGLGMAFRCRYRGVKDVNDLERAIENMEEAVRLTPKNHQSLASRLARRGRYYDLRRGLRKKGHFISMTPK